MSLLVTFKGQFQNYPLTQDQGLHRVKRSRRSETIVEDLLRYHMDEEEFNDIIEKHQKNKKAQSKNTAPNPYQQRQDKTPKKIDHRFIHKAVDIMTNKPECLEQQAPISSAIERILHHGHRHFPILDQQKLVGILSDRDILLAASQKKKKEKIKDFMQTRVVTALEQTELKQIVQVILAEGIGCLPIINNDKLLTGIITRSDLLRVLLMFPSLNIDA